MINKVILNYRIIREIGQGGMGTVYLAENINIREQQVAIKVINADMLNDFTRERLRQEAQRLAELNHNNIVNLNNYHKDEQGNVYLIMEYANGTSIETYLNEVHGLITEEQILPLFNPILDGMSYAHKHDVIHCDIKPSNIIINSEGTPKILDFGIAKIVGDQQNSSNFIMGTPSYMSPEQVNGEPLDARSDIYSLGVLLHQMLTGNAPYDTTTLTEQQINEKVVNEPLPRMKQYYKYVSEKMQRVVDKATAKKPDDRYQSCEEFKRAINRAINPRRLPLWGKIAAVAAIVLMVGAGWYVWDYNRVKTYYYKDYVEKMGVPQGIGKLSSGEHKHAHYAYKFVYQKHKLQRVTFVNSLDNPIDINNSESTEKAVDQEFTYADNGNVSRVKVKDRSGKVQYIKSYNENMKIMAFQFDDELNTERTISNKTVSYNLTFENDDNTKGRISRFKIEYDDNGYVSKEEFYAWDNSPVPDENGIYGRIYVRDDRGRPIEVHYIGVDGKPQSTRWGLGVKKHEYDKDDNLVKTSYYTCDMKPACDIEDGIFSVENTYDEYGNCLTDCGYDSSGKPMYHRHLKRFGQKVDYDDQGFATQVSFTDQVGKPMFLNELGASVVKYEYDKNGYVNKTTFCDTKGNIHSSRNGYAIIEQSNDEHGNPVEFWFRDEHNNLCKSNEGVAGFKLEYDSVGNMTKRIGYGVDKSPATINGMNVSGARYAYNDMNQLVKQVNLGKDLTPAPDNNGIVVCTFEYNKRGNITKNSYFKADEKTPNLCNDGYAGMVTTYDDNTGLLTQCSYLGASGEPVMSLSDHYCTVKYDYDKNGFVSSIRYYDAESRLTLSEGIAGTDYIHDRNGNVLEDKPIGVNGDLAYGKLITKYNYDQYNNIIEQSFFDKTSPAVNYEGWHKVKNTYNSQNQKTEERYYDTKGNLTLHQDGYAIAKYGYDAQGNTNKVEFFGVDSKPCTYKEGYSCIKREFDAFGNITKECYFGVDGKPTDPNVIPPVGIAKYDGQNNIIYAAAQDGKGNYINHGTDNWAIKRWKYDDQSNLISESYYDINDKPIIGAKEQYHLSNYSYDKQGNLIESKFFGVQKEPILVNGYHKEVITYDSKNGLEVKREYFGTTGKAVDCNNGFHKYVLTYDGDNVPMTVKYYTAAGKLMATQHYNKNTGEWGTPQASSSQATNVSGADWRANVRQGNSECPVTIDDGVVLTSVTASSNTVNVNVKLIYFSKSEMNDEQLSAVSQLKQQLRQYMKQTLSLPSSVSVVVNVVDKNNRRV